MKPEHEQVTRAIHRLRAPIPGTLCRHLRGAVSPAGSRTVVDESRSLAITAWTCADCGDLIEEIRILSRGGGVQSVPIRYAVVPQAIGGPATSVAALT